VAEHHPLITCSTFLYCVNMPFLNCFNVLAIYSRTVVRQLSYVRRSYDIDTAPFAIHETWCTSDWRKCERKSATYLHMSYDRHRRQFY